MEPENNFTEISGMFVSILSDSRVTSEGMDDILKKAQGILSQSHGIFITQNDDSQKLKIQKRLWVRWLIRRLLAICIEQKEALKIKERCRETLELIIKKASLDSCLLNAMTENFIVLLEGKFIVTGRGIKYHIQRYYHYPLYSVLLTLEMIKLEYFRPRKGLENSFSCP